MMSLYDLIEGMLELLGTIYYTGAMTIEEEKLLNKYESVWYNYYEKELRSENDENC